MILKNKSYICPFCGSDETENIVSEIDEESMINTMECSHCNKIWSENFTLTYCGFSFFAPNDENPKYFNRFGEKIE